MIVMADWRARILDFIEKSPVVIPIVLILAFLGLGYLAVLVWRLVP